MTECIGQLYAALVISWLRAFPGVAETTTEWLLEWSVRLRGHDKANKLMSSIRVPSFGNCPWRSEKRSTTTFGHATANSFIGTRTKVIIQRLPDV